MEFIHFIGSLDSSSKLAIAYLIAFCIVVFLAFKSPTVKRSHEWRIKSATRLLDKLQTIGAERGPAAQFKYIRCIDSAVFEEAILTSIEREGHRIKRNERYTGDGGIDGECEIDGVKVLIQAKRYSGHISREHLASFVVKCHEARHFGLFVHAGRTGEGLKSLGDGVVAIVSGTTLLQCLGISKESTDAKPWRTVLHKSAARGWQT